MKKSLPPPYCFYLEAAVGWLELGNPREALAELEAIEPPIGGSPQVLEVKWQILARMENWEGSLPIARAFCEVSPTLPQGWLHQAVSLYRLNRTEEAWNLLLPMADKFPRSWVIPYDLSCYACQLGRLEESRKWLHTAIRLGESKEVKLLALADPDLKLLWPEIEDFNLSAERETGSTVE